MRLKITNKNKVFFKNPKITKGEIVNYYQKIAPYMLPHVKNRPVNMLRAPDGMLGNIFFQQNMPVYFPKWIDFFNTFRIRGGFARHVLINKPETLVYLANEGAVTIHIWNSRIKNIKNPDRIVFDLDPPPNRGGGFELAREAAFLLKSELEKIGVKPYVMTTGSKGVHLIIPIKPDAAFKKVKMFARQFVSKIEAKYSEKITSNFLKSKRTSKVFIDYFRNNYGQTAVAPYSVRLKSGAPVAAPIFWSDLHKKDFGPQTINIKNIFQYLKKGDPWGEMYRGAKSVRYYQEKIKDKI